MNKSIKEKLIKSHFTQGLSEFRNFTNSWLVWFSIEGSYTIVESFYPCFPSVSSITLRTKSSSLSADLRSAVQQIMRYSNLVWLETKAWMKACALLNERNNLIFATPLIWPMAHSVILLKCLEIILIIETKSRIHCSPSILFSPHPGLVEHQAYAPQKTKLQRWHVVAYSSEQKPHLWSLCQKGE